MHVDVIDLKDFYGSALGRVAQQFVAHALRAHWPDMQNCNLLGFGYTAPYMRGYEEGSTHSLAFMPAAQGVVRWPSQGPNRAVLSEETQLPLPDSCIDKVLVVHGLEMSPSANELFAEFWRVLKPGGRLLVVVPNRRGLWARADATPFGHGRPFSRRQLQRLFRDTQFAPEKWSESLFMPPLSWRPLLRWAKGWEQLGYSLWPAFSGLVIAEAAKDMYAGALTPKAQRARRGLRGVILPVPATSRTLNPVIGHKD